MERKTSFFSWPSLITMPAGMLSSAPALFVLVAILTIIESIVVHLFFSDWRGANIALHSLVENLGAFIALSLSVVILLVRKHRGYVHGVLVSCALIGGGILDIFHASVQPGNSFIWLHSTAILIGGTLFSLVWLSRYINQYHWANKLPSWVLFAIGILGLFSVIFPHHLPAMLISQNDFTATAKIINFSGGIFFLFAALYFSLSYRINNVSEDLLFASLCLLIGFSGLVFPFSSLWSANWWYWHLLRLAGFSIAFYHIFFNLRRTEDEIKTANQQLRASNQQLRATEQQLRASNQQLGAAEQQLRASNEQLRASEQQLRAANQQLRASEQQLRAEVEERKKAEKELKKLSSAVEQTADIIIITDKHGAIEYVNPTFTKVTGYTKEEAIGKTSRILKSGKHDQKFYELLWQTILSGKVFRDTLTNKKKNGELYYTEKTITPIRDKEGCITHFVSVDKDITERKEIEKTQRLVQLGKLVADMSHEVNNPLMIISGNAQLSLMEEIQNKEVENNLKIIQEECNRASGIIQRLLKFSRPTKGERKETDINQSIDAVLKLIENQFFLDNIKMQKNFSENLPLLIIDEKQIQEVLINLFNNARDAMQEGGVMTIATSLADEFIKIEIKDSGVGMDTKALSKLFEPFYTTKEKGTGLGLSVCYGIVKDHNGELKFESEPGKGTTATVMLPIRR